MEILPDSPKTVKLPKKEAEDLAHFLGRAILRALDEGETAIHVLAPGSELWLPLPEARSLLHTYMRGIIDAEKRGSQEVSIHSLVPPDSCRY
jgi:hypothetical protein